MRFLLSIQRAKHALENCEVTVRSQRKHVLLRAELLHIVNNLQAGLPFPFQTLSFWQGDRGKILNYLQSYVMARIASDGTGDLNLDDLLSRAPTVATSMHCRLPVNSYMPVLPVKAHHEKYLKNIRDRCLLNKKANVIAAAVRQIFDLALKVSLVAFSHLGILISFSHTEDEFFHQLDALGAVGTGACCCCVHFTATSSFARTCERSNVLPASMKVWRVLNL